MKNHEQYQRRKTHLMKSYLIHGLILRNDVEILKYNTINCGLRMGHNSVLYIIMLKYARALLDIFYFIHEILHHIIIIWHTEN